MILENGNGFLARPVLLTLDQLDFHYRVATNLENLEYSGISLNMEN